MFNCTRIKSVEYYEAQARVADAENDAGLKPSEIGRNGERRDAVSYYQDNGAADAAGVWFVARKDYDPETGEVLENDTPTSSLLPSPLSSLAHGQEVDGKTLRRLAAARDPETGQPIENSRTGKPLRPVGKDGEPKGSVGYDMQISAPKSVSVLAMTADPETRAVILAAHDRAVERALDFVVDDGLLYSRSGKGGHDREKVTEIAAARYRHLTSRAGDPQLHTHSVFLNMARRADGSMGTIDNQEAMRYGGAIAALYRTELAAILKAELGLEAVQDGRNFQVAGISEAVVERFSKRRAQIEAEVADTARNRAAAQVAAFNTRGEKADLPDMVELEARWQRELAAEGWSGDTLLQAAQAASRDLVRQGEAQEQPTLIDRAEAAVARLMQNEAVFERRQLFRAVLEELQTSGTTADEALGVIERLEAEGRIVRVGMDGNEAVYSTGTMVELERNMLRAAIERQNERQFIDPATLDRILAKFPTIKDEQEAAVRHALNSDGVAVVEGLAGTGKSFATGALREIAEAAGLQVHGIAPSWKATDVLRIDAGLAEEYARAVAGTVLKLEKGEIVWNAKTVVVVDEAGMVGTADMAALVRHAKAAGAKLVLQGDTRQLQPVVAGAPMKALATALGAARMEDIQRQKGTNEAEGEWMRAASVDLATGDPTRALEAYDRAGAVKLIEDREALIEQLVADYVADRELPDFMVREDGKKPSRAILTAWNVDVNEINARVRASLQQNGSLAADSVEIEAAPRGGGKPQALALAVGDEIIFGETVELDRVTIRNSDIARIEGIEGDPQDPLLTIALAKGETFTARASQLVGYRDPEGDEPAVPRMQHAYAMTIHASQGVTVDRAWVANIRGMGRESLYVSMTRHRQSVKLYAESGRIYDALAAKAGGKAAAVSSQGVSLPEDDDDPAGDPTPDAVKKALFEEGLRSDRKANAADFVGDVREWIGVPAAPTPAAVMKVANQETAPTIRAKLDAAAQGFRRFGSTRPASVPTPSPTVATSSPAQDLAQRQTQRENAPAGYRAQWADRPAGGGRITQEERDQMVRVDLLQFAQDHLGFSAKAVETWRGAAVLLNPAGEKIAFTQRGEGGPWVWTESGKRSGGEGGMIWNLVARETGRTVGQAMHWLREKLGTWTADPARRIETTSGKVVNGAGIDPEAMRKTLYRWSKMQGGASAYLVNERGLDPALLKRLGADVKAEGSDQFAAGNEHGAAFAYRDAAGQITGYSRRGFHKPDDKGRLASFRQARGEPNLWQSKDGIGEPRRIYASESGIDTISRYQLDGQQGPALLTATEGQPSARALEIYRDLARRYPGVEWHVAMDDDEAGRSFAEKVKAAILEGDPKAAILDRRSPSQFKDANDELKGVTREEAAKLAADRQAAYDAEERRRREEEEARKTAEPTNRPRFR